VSGAPPNCCPACGVHLPELGELRERVELLEDAQQDLQNQLIAKRAEVTRLRRDRNERRLSDPLMPQAQQVYDHWKATLAPRARVNDCRPSCAGGTIHRRPVRVRLDRRRYCPRGDAHAYTRMRYRLGGRLPAGVRRRARMRYTCASFGL
jgi:hypothetical protein